MIHRLLCVALGTMLFASAARAQVFPAPPFQGTPSADSAVGGPTAGLAFTPVYVVREKNPADAALYALAGFPGVVPLGQLYNGEMRKAGDVLKWKLTAIGVGLLGYLFSEHLTEIEEADARRVGRAVVAAAGLAYFGVSVHSVVDAALSADRITRSIAGTPPCGIKVGLTKGL